MSDRRSPGLASTSQSEPSRPHVGRGQVFRQLLDAQFIDKRRLQDLAFGGVPDDQGIRPLVWKVIIGWGSRVTSRALQSSLVFTSCRLESRSRAHTYESWTRRPRPCSDRRPRPCRQLPVALPVQLLLGYLPEDRSQWERSLAKHRDEYAQFCKVCAAPDGLRPSSARGPPENSRRPVRSPPCCVTASAL